MKPYKQLASEQLTDSTIDREKYWDIVRRMRYSSRQK